MRPKTFFWGFLWKYCFFRKNCRIKKYSAFNFWWKGYFHFCCKTTPDRSHSDQRLCCNVPHFYIPKYHFFLAVVFLFGHIKIFFCSFYVRFLYSFCVWFLVHFAFCVTFCTHFALTFCVSFCIRLGFIVAFIRLSFFFVQGLPLAFVFHFLHTCILFYVDFHLNFCD